MNARHVAELAEMQFDVMAGVMQNWLDADLDKRKRSKWPVDDEVHVMRLTPAPSRKQLKAWIKALNDAKQLMSEQK